MDIRHLLCELHRIEVIKLGNFTLKSGRTSPVYFDLRPIVSVPSLLQAVSERMWEKIHHLNYDHLCGVPYTALPIATCISIAHERPLLMRRKEAKVYGTKRKIEGLYQPGDTTVIVEDVVTSGASVKETLIDLQEAGLKTQDVVVFLDREEGGREALNEAGLNLHAVFGLHEFITLVGEHVSLNTTEKEALTSYLQCHTHS